MGGLTKRRVAGRFDIESEAGAGGAGTVYRARDLTTGDRVALKVLRSSMDAGAERFLREAETLARLGHPSVVRYVAHGVTEDGEPFLAMEWLEGRDLRRHLAEEGLTIAQSVALCALVADALAAVHAAGVLHRDVKPSNIFLVGPAGDRADEVKLIDFGLVRLEEVSRSLTRTGVAVGTPGYMSPEQAAGHAVDARTDIFALGVVLYEMAAGVRPFPGATAIEIIIAAARDEPARLSKATSDASPALGRVIFRCLEKNADARYATARELMAALDEVGDRDGVPLQVAQMPRAATEAFGQPTLQSLVRSADLSPRRRGRPWMPMAALAIVAVVVTLAFRPAAWRDAPKVASKPAVAPPPQATSITDQRPPPSSNPELLSEYAAGLQALRDDDWGVAQDHFMRVVELDPFLALGQLRLAMAAEGTLDESLRREHYTKAVGLRSQLGPRDEGMMQALEPVLLRLREDRAEAARRLGLLSERYPGDAEIHVWRALLQEHTIAGLASADRATALDPNDGQAWQSRGNILASLGRGDEARISFERCGAISPGSSECFLGLIWLDSMEGRCSDAERDARRSVDRDPHLAGNLACVMYGAGRPIEAVREVLDQSAAAFGSAPRMQWQRIVDQTRAALVAGDFMRARALAEQSQALADGNVHAVFRDHLLPALVLVAIARETGDDAQAFRVAWDFTRRSDTWSKSTQGDGGIDASLWLARQTVRAGGLSREEFRSRRASWIEEEQKNLAATGLIWTYAFASTAETSEEATAALATLTDYAPLSSFAYYVGIPDAEIGSTYLRAGQVDSAIPYLAKAVANCSAFRHPFVHTRATLQLGQALESKGDARGACSAYAKVVERWGNARPRSVSAENARLRLKALACGT